MSNYGRPGFCCKSLKSLCFIAIYLWFSVVISTR
jgi:hypothetical protein